MLRGKPEKFQADRAEFRAKEQLLNFSLPVRQIVLRGKSFEQLLARLEPDKSFLKAVYRYAPTRVSTSPSIMQNRRKTTKPTNFNTIPANKYPVNFVEKYIKDYPCTLWR
ncbi:MAG: hypothetical protein RIA63_00600 [Cyclobacteriaceae bacterium]